VLRPLIGNDKEENVAMAKAIGTYEKSCLPVMSCQAVPKKPRTRAKLERIIDLEKELYIPGLMRKSQGSLRDVTGYL
jgi:thiamine biosynthesis protein ThiI